MILATIILVFLSLVVVEAAAFDVQREDGLTPARLTRRQRRNLRALRLEFRKGLTAGPWRLRP